MGQRSINTVIRLSNESEYRTALRNCNSELKNLKSQLALTASEFRNNANSLDALKAKNEILSKMYFTQEKQVNTLRGALEKATQTRDQEEETVKSLKEEYAKAQKTLADYGKEVDKNSEEYKQAEAEVNRLLDATIKHEAKLDSSTNAVNKYSGQLNRAQIELNKLKDQQDENNRLMYEAKHAADGCATSIDRYGDAVVEAADGTGKSASAVEALAGALVAGGVQQRVEDVAEALMECANASAEFETAISKVYTLADNSVLSESKMKTGIMEISNETGKAADEIGEAVYQALSAGVETANVLDFVRSSTKLSVAGFTDAANSVDVLTTILNSYGIEASKTEQVASKLVKTQDLGKITVDELGKVMGRVIPSAAAYNVNLDNIATSYAHMTASGINAENTTTYLSTMLDELADSGSDVAAVLKQKTGKSFAELMGSGKSLGDVLGILSDSVEGNKTEFSGLWSSATAGRGALALLNSGVEKFNATMDVMENSSGSVAVNFEKMTANSEFASQRVSVASKNLKIAVGDQLNPVLNNLRNTGADIMESAADIVSRSPALVATITGVVTAVGLLAAGLSALMVVKSVTAAMAALNITLAANPVGLIAVGVVSLGAALATLAANTKGADEELNALTESSRKLADTVSETNQSYADSVSSVDAAYDVVSKYIDRLEELEAQGLKTKNQQVEYAMIIDQINATIPELNASLDEQTGLVNGGTDALKRQAEQWKKTAMQEAAYARYKEDIAALADAQYELAKNEVLEANAKKRKKEIVDQLAVAQEKLIMWTHQLNTATIQDGETVDQFNHRYIALQNTVNAYISDVSRLQAEESKNAEQIALYEKAVAACKDTIAEQSPVVDAVTEAWNNMSTQVGESVQTVSEQSEEMATGVSGALNQMSEEYLELQNSARQSLDSQVGLFDTVKTKCGQSTQEMIQALQSQKKAFDEYATNITLAMERGIDIGLVQQLSDGSTESMAILAQLVSGTDTQIGELNAAFSAVGQSKDAVATAMADVKQTVKDGLQEASGTAYDSGFEVGVNTGSGIVKGFTSQKGSYTNAVAGFAKAGIDKYRQFNMIQSPSKKWAELAKWDVAGLTTTYKQSIPKIEAQSAELANSGYVAAIRAKQRQLPQLARVAAAAPLNNQSALEGKLDNILAAIKAGRVLAIDGKTLVGATADQYDAQMGQMRMLKERGAK